MTRAASTLLAAALPLAGVNGRVELADLRDALPSLPRVEVDAALRELHHGRRIVLSREDNAGALTRRAEAAALYVGECPRHLAYLQGAR